MENLNKLHIIDLMQLMSMPYVAKCEMDNEQKARYYAAILSGKDDVSKECKCGGAVCELLSHKRKK